MKKILITGASGCTGQGVIKYFRENHAYEILGLVRKKRRDLEPGARYIEGDLQDRSSLEKIFRESRIDSLFHVGGAVDPHNNKELFYRVNKQGTRELVDLAVRAGVGEIIYCSSTSVYGKFDQPQIDEEHPLNPQGHYARSKLMAENIITRECEKAGITGGILRLPIILGKNDRHLYPRLILFNRFHIIPMFGDPGHRLSIVHPGDIARAFVAVSEKRFRKINSFHVVSCNPTFRELMLKTAGAYNRNPYYTLYIPYPLLYAGAFLIEMTFRGVPPYKEATFSREYARMIGREWTFATSRIEKAGYSPIMDIDAIVNDMVP
ncbi:MAG: NAD(P)-dependent oxidoreductase [Spirochaetales bacterium]|nr:NAD(P)-dependent oxidoreductase [Spirochaetales bacterium]